MSAEAAGVPGTLRELVASLTGDTRMLAADDRLPLLAGGAALDSLSAAVLLAEIERRYRIDVAGEDLNLDCLATLGTLTEFITERLGEASCETG